ncbi:MAG: hypothetical protein GYB51_06995 [Rhodobacteraceae bacterium]|nr:hypothetical protein [Paracoccaceae bacterium]
MKRSFLAICLLSLAPPASALDFTETLMLQSTLKEHGFDVGEPDGRMGPSTRRGIDEFAKVYEAPTDPDALFDYMLKRSREARESVTDEGQLEAIKAGVADLLRDPSSAQIRDVFRVRLDSTTMVCGQVNGKNAYGGYAGFSTFYGFMLGSGAAGTESFLPISVDGPDSPIALYSCMLAFPSK